MTATIDSASSTGTGSYAVSTPLGRPVVPELYSMSVPATRSSSGSGDIAASACS